MLLATSATDWRCHLGESPGPGARSLLPCPCLGCGSKEPRDARKHLDGPGLVPEILPPTGAASQLLKVKGDKSKSWSGTTENGENEAKDENGQGVAIELTLDFVSLFYPSVLLSVGIRICLLSGIPGGPGPHLSLLIAKLVRHPCA